MTWHFPQSGTTSPILADGDDVFVAQQVFLNVPLSGLYSGHEVIVAGTVASGNGVPIFLGSSPEGAPTASRWRPPARFVRSTRPELC